MSTFRNTHTVMQEETGGGRTRHRVGSTEEQWGGGPEEERLDIRRGEKSVRKNQCDSMTPLGVFSVSLCADGMVPETPLGQKPPLKHHMN